MPLDTWSLGWNFARSRSTPGAELFARYAGGTDGGDGLVCLHGGPGISHDYMLDLFRLASPTMRVVLFDQRGVGRSTGDPDERLVHTQVADVAAVARACGVGRVHLLGHSGGGYTLMFQARLGAPDVASAVFVDPVAATSDALADALGSLNRHIEDAVAAGNVVLRTDGTPTDWLHAVAPAYDSDPSHPRARFHRDTTYSEPVFLAFQEVLGRYDFRADLSRFAVPSLVFVCGTPFTPAMAATVADALPAAWVERVDLPRCGHVPWVEQPDVFDDAVRALWQRAGVR